MNKITKILLLVFLLSPQLIWGGTTGKIAGKIVDAKTGEPLLGANIMIMNTTLGASSDMDGSFYIINVPPGTYDLKASYIGYEPVILKQVVVNIDRTTSVDFSLNATGFETNAVEVVANREGVIRDLTATSSQINADDIKKLPVESIGDVISLQVGMTQDNGGGLHLRGGRSAEVEYVVDGISVTNPFGGGLTVAVENNSVQQLEVISGTYNAEYGRAMSGIVNIVTKDGGQKLSGTVSAYAGDFLSSHNNLFMNIDEINPLNQKYFDGSLGGPVPFLPNTSFFVSTRVTDEDGWLSGQKKHSPKDSANFSGTNPRDWYIEYTGDNSIVPMNTNNGVSYQAKLSTSISEKLKITYNFMGDYNRWKDFENAYKYNPDFKPLKRKWGYNHFLSFINPLSASTINELRLNYYTYEYKESAYEDPFDPRYISEIHAVDMPNDLFSIGGVNTGFGYRKSQTISVKYDFTSQLHKEHLVKIGAEVRQHVLNDESYSVRKDEGTNWQLRIDPLSSRAHDKYTKKPTEASAYVQDKIEIKDFIVNAGVRFDYFDAASYVPRDMTDPSNQRGKSFLDAYRKVDPKLQFSPRIGMAFPISDGGSLHASFGEFFQMPELGRLYENQEFEVIGTFEDFIGNADLEPQKTTSFEIGLQQRLNEFLVLNTTCYYKDIRNLAGTKLYKTFDQVQYGQYVNVDYGSVWGITVALDLMRVSMFSSTIDYTYQVAEGNGSDPKQAFYDAGKKDEATKTLIPLEWDQTHVLNWVVNLDGEDWGASLITSVNSGNPYTPTTSFVEVTNTQFRNLARRKPKFNIDMRVYKNIALAGVSMTVFMKVENLLDMTYSEYYPQLKQKDYESHASMDFINSLYEYRNNPASQPMPRLVKLGLTLNL